MDLTKLEQRRASLEGKLASANAALKQAQRRDDTRRKVVVGAALLAAVQSGRLDAKIIAFLAARMPERDRALVADLLPPVAAGETDREPRA
ncbi:hypothetical protein [Aureimonas mangrovi]|uniref:hypothetical protein n=1 Tax=Aureimonas mangrovi TaxID=2758041 RepID=UPI00163D499C|nr:hypothetical protein [Aureimonas mangrovi]